MANVLDMADQATITALWRRGWSQRRIARETGIHRETVGRYVHLAALAEREVGGSKPAISTPGSDQAPPAPCRGDPSEPAIPTAGSDRPKPAISTLGSMTLASAGPPGRRSLCEPLREVIQAKLETGLSAVRIWQDLVGEQQFEGSYQSVKRFVRQLETAAALPFRRMECNPGDEAQVDFGTGAAIVTPEGKRRRTHVFRVVLSYSRKAYSEAVYQQTTEQFIRCLENAFIHFGGVPKTLVIDNLKAAVTRADWYEPQLNRKILSFCEHYGTVVLPTRPRTPRHKGKVERIVGYVQDNALKGKYFTSLSEQNRYLLDWETHTADQRIHGTTRKQVKNCFEGEERSALLALPASRFPSFNEGKRKVSRDGHIEVARRLYSVPPEYLGREVWARWDSHLVRIFNQRFEQIAVHVPRPDQRFHTDERHIDPRKRGGIERGAAWLLSRAGLIGPHAGRWAEQVIRQRGIEGMRAVMGLLDLGRRHAADAIDQACETACTHGAYRLATIRELLGRQSGRQSQFDFIDQHPIIRSLAEYGQLVHTAFGE